MFHIVSFLLGIFVAGVTSYILGQIHLFGNAAQRSNNRLNTFPASIQPQLTPSGIVSDANLAFLLRIIWILFMLGWISGIVWFFLRVVPGMEVVFFEPPSCYF